MLRADWKILTRVLPGGRRALIVLAGVSFVSALLEAGVLVLVVAAALSVSDGTGSIDVPLLGDRIRPAVALGCAGVGAVLSLAGHLYIADLSAKLSSRFAYQLRSTVIDAFHQASWTRQSTDREGSVQETVTSLATQGSQVALSFATLIVASIGLAALFTTALVVDPLVTLFVILFAAVIFLALRPLTTMTRRRAKVWVASGRVFAEQVAAWTTMIMDLRVFGVEDVHREALRSSNQEVSRSTYRTRVATRIGTSLYKDLALIFLVGAVAVLNGAGDVDVAAVGSVVLLVVRSVNYAQQAQGALQQVGEVSPAMHSVLERATALELEREQWGTREVDRLGEIELRGVTYSYEPGEPALDGVDLTIAPGEIIGVIGPSGGGKSTLVQLLMRLRVPGGGTIRVAGGPYEEVSPQRWRRLVSLVPQEPRLFEGSIAENIAFFRTWIDEDDVRQASADAHILEDILRLPDQMATRLGPRGVGLSGGQKQRVAIARALAGKPQLLVLDEPTSALDLRSEEALQRTIAGLRGHLTMVIVTHRLSTLRSCDRVLVLERGRQELLGPREEVLASAGFLADLGVRGDPAPSAARTGDGPVVDRDEGAGSG